MTSVRRSLGSARRLDMLVASNLARLDDHICAAIPDLVRKTLDVPYVFLSLVGDRRQVVIRQAGLPDDRRIETIPILHSICRYVVACGYGMAIEDTELNVLTAGDPLLRQNDMRAYLGMPLRFRGEILGTLCAFDTRPRDWTAAEADALSHLARFAEYELAVGGSWR